MIKLPDQICGDQKSDFTWFFISSQPAVVQRALSSTGFCQTRVSLSKWTINMGIYHYQFLVMIQNPGPESFQNVLHWRNSGLYTHCSTTTTYSHAELFSIHRRSKLLFSWLLFQNWSQLVFLNIKDIEAVNKTVSERSMCAFPLLIVQTSLPLTQRSLKHLFMLSEYVHKRKRFPAY